MILDYYTNPGPYAKNCISKSRTTVRCKGKCQMIRRIREEERDAEQQALKFQYKAEVLSEK